MESTGLWNAIKYAYVPYLKITNLPDNPDFVLVKSKEHTNIILTRSQAIELAARVNGSGKNVKAPKDIMQIVEDANYDPISEG